MLPNLSFEQAPPISIPYRFFLAAPLFGIACGVLAMIYGPESLSSRWAPAALAMTHSLAAGFVLQAVCGAMFQLIPVAAGGNVWRPRLVAAILQPALIVGTLLLLGGFLLGGPVWFQCAGPILAIAIGGLAIVFGAALLQTPARGMTLTALRLSVGGLTVTGILGAVLTGVLGWGWHWSLPNLVDIHAVWGLGGWALILIVGVSYFVVPMFQLTPAYPRSVSRAVPIGLFVACLLCSGKLIPVFAGGAWGDYGSGAVGMVMVAWYVGSTLSLLRRRRRKISDVTLRFWRCGLYSLLAIPVGWLTTQALPSFRAHPRTLVVFGVLMFVGVFVSMINGMLYKIVPFLNWMHLQRLSGPRYIPPNMNQMISESAMRSQMGIHLLAFGLLLAAVLTPALSRIAGLALASSCAWLEWNLIAALLVYRRGIRECRASAIANVGSAG